MALHPDVLLEALREHQGEANGITGEALIGELQRLGQDCSTRDLRLAVETLRADGHHVCAVPGRGYFLALTPDELQRSLDFLHRRAMTTLRQISRMSAVAIPDLFEQMRARLEMPEEPSQ